MKLIPGKWCLLCRTCQQDVYFRNGWGWWHEGYLIPDHAPVPFAIKAEDMFAAMGIKIATPMDEAVEKLTEVITDAGLDAATAIIHGSA